MPVGTRQNWEGDVVAAYVLPLGIGQHSASDASLVAMEEARAQFARDAQAEHEALQSGGDRRWHKAEGKRYERLMRAFRIVTAWLDGTTKDLQAHRFPLEMAAEFDAAFRFNSVVQDNAA